MKPLFLCTTLYVLLTTFITTVMFSPTSSAQDDSAIAEVRRAFQLHTPENFDNGGEISHYVWKNFNAFFPHATIARTIPVRELREAPSADVADFIVRSAEGSSTFHNYVSSNPQIDAVLVLVDGEIAYESYPRMQPFERHLGWSITKVIVSTALAALEHQGRVDMESPVEHYLAALPGRA